MDANSEPPAQPRKLVAIEQRDSRGSRRTRVTARARNRRALIRTVLLGSLALGAGIWYLFDTFSVEPEQWLGYATTGALMVAALVSLAALSVLAVRAVAKLLRKSD